MNEINVLVCYRTLPSEEIMTMLRKASPRLVVKAVADDDVAKTPGLWDNVEVLYTDDPLPPEGAAPKLKWIQGNYAGVDRWGRLPVTQPYIWTTTIGIHTQVAEMALALMLTWSRKVPLILENQKKAYWPPDRFSVLEPLELRGSTVGVIGYGSIGRQVGYLCKAFGMRVLAADRAEVLKFEPAWRLPGTPSVAECTPHQLYDPADVKSMVKECDWVVLCVPSTPQTHHMINGDVLAAMKPTAVLINVGRGEVVDEKALIQALEAGKIRGAGLDVYTEEPLPSSSPIWAIPNVVAAPHVGGLSPNYFNRAMQIFAENLRRYAAGEPLMNVVDKEKGY